MKESGTEQPRHKKLLDEHHRLNLRVEELEQELECLTSSVSWRFTEPLRNLKAAKGFLLSWLSFGEHALLLNPFNDLLYKDEAYHLTGPAPFFVLGSSKKRLPVGWVEVSLSAMTERSPKEFMLYFDTGHGFSESERIYLSFEGRNSVLVKLPRFVRTLRLDPIGAGKEFVLKGLTAKELSALRVYSRAIRKKLERVSGWQNKQVELYEILNLFYSGGLPSVKKRLFLPCSSPDLDKSYQKWIRKFDTLTDTDRIAVEKQISTFKSTPLISILMPVYNTPEKWLRKALDSVLAQLYQNWELCIADDASTRPTVKEVLEEYKLRDSRIKVHYREQNGHISKTSNSALEMAGGEFVVLMDHDDEIREDALFYVVNEINSYPDVNLIYSDEDRITKEGDRREPYFKPDWDPDLMLSQNLISHLGAYKTEVAKKIGGFREGYEGSQDWDFSLRFIEKIEQNTIRHIPRVLYHWRLVPGTVSFTVETKADAFDAGRRSLESFIERSGQDALVTRTSGGCLVHYNLPQDTPEVVVLVPVDSVECFKQLPPLLQSSTDYANFKIVAYTSSDSLLYEINGTKLPGVALVGVDSGTCGAVLNQVVDKVGGDYLVFLDNGLQPQNKEWLTILVSHALRDEIGAVGGKLISHDGSLLQAGYFLAGQKIAYRRQFGLPKCEAGYFNLARLPQNVSALGKECLCVGHELIRKLGGFDPALRENFLDIDLCLKIRREGFRVLWTPEVVFSSFIERKREIRTEDKAYFLKKWGPKLAFDPFYNPNLALEEGGYTLAMPPRNSDSWHSV